jgi:hypothetical protein
LFASSKMVVMTDLDDLYSELEELAQPAKKGGPSPRNERILAGFEEIQRFFETHGRAPQHGEDRDIFERLYAVRLDRLRALEECRTILAPLDHQGLLTGAGEGIVQANEAVSDDDLLSELGDLEVSPALTELKHVRSRAEIQFAEEIASREKCLDFDKFKSLFTTIEDELKSGTRKAVRFGQNASVELGHFFILGGQTVYVAEIGESFQTPNGHPDARMRVIYANRTESNILMRSLQRALYKDEAGRRITDPDFGPLFGETLEDGDVESGTIYVLRSLSCDPYITERRDLIHKIGVTSGKVETRIANAVNDATYLLADVEIVATYVLSGINRTKLEKLIHKIFSPAQLDLIIKDRFGHPVKPREWFIVPLAAIDEAIERIRNGSITSVVYDPKKAQLVER